MEHIAERFLGSLRVPWNGISPRASIGRRYIQLESLRSDFPSPSSEVSSRCIALTIEQVQGSQLISSG